MIVKLINKLYYLFHRFEQTIKKLRVSLILPIIERLKIKLSNIVGPEEHQLMTNMRSLILDELNRRVKDNEFISLCCLSRSQRDQKGIVGNP